MAPLKFEDEIREQLSKRKLPVSKGAWERLETQLNAQEQKKNNDYKKYLAIAAGFISAILVISIFLNTGDDVVDDTPILVKREQKILEKAAEKNLEKIVMSEGDAGIGKRESMMPERHLKPKKKSKEQEIVVAIKKQESIEKLVASENLEKNEYGRIIVEKEIPEALIDTMVSQLAVTVQQLEEDNYKLTDTEVDSLLYAAQRDILAQKITNQSKQSIDATALLLDVETELDQSFKEQVFEALKTSFNKVRTAIADREN